MGFLVLRLFLRMVMFVICAGAVVEHKQLHISTVGQFFLIVAAVISFIMFAGDN